MPHRPFVALFSTLALLTGAGCGGVVGPSENRIDEFSGFVDPLGDGEQHDFSVSRNGEYEVRLSALEPSAGVFLEIAVGQFVGGACQQPIGIGIGGLNTVALVGPIVAGQYCVLVFDEGLITQRVAYTVRVSHP